MTRTSHRSPRRASRAAESSSASNGNPARIRKPSAWRVVTSRTLRVHAPSGRVIMRRVPQIRMSGAWLARVGFPEGARFLISVDREAGIMYLQIEAT